MLQFKVFVYGTLLVGESNHHVAKPYLLHVEEGTIKGFLYSLGPYPAIVLDDNGVDIKGEWLTVNQLGLERMDWLEDYQENGQNNDYERVWVKDSYTENEGFVYVYSLEKVKGLKRIESGSWREYRKSNLI
ncbi:gamma-glutamylcyclotransferase family protein [Schinkia sp. CFF1]